MQSLEIGYRIDRDQLSSNHFLPGGGREIFSLPVIAYLYTKVQRILGIKSRFRRPLTMRKSSHCSQANDMYLYLIINTYMYMYA